MRRGRKSSVLLVHPGTQHSFRLARVLSENERLGGFWTGLAVHRDGDLFRALQRLPLTGVRAAIANRVVDGIPREKLHTKPWAELSALAAIRLGFEQEKIVLERNRRFQECIPISELRDASAVVGFDTASWILAPRTSSVGVPFILDRSAPPIAPSQATFEILAQRYSDWRGDVKQSSELSLDAERREHLAASTIVVASSYTKRGLLDLGVSPGRIETIGYGVDSTRFVRRHDRESVRDVRFLYAGAVNARKGVPLLLEAWRSLAGHAGDLTVAGPLAAARARLLESAPRVSWRDKVPHADMPALYASHDVLVFPTYHDGFGLVILEAMASGLPVIATDASAGPDLITEGVDGFVVPRGDGEALADRMAWFAGHPDKISEMGEAAREKARQFSWERYGNAWEQLLVDRGFV